MTDVSEDMLEALRRAGLVDAASPPPEPLAGGVSCDVWKLEGPAGPIVLKRPLAQLRVEADWRAPVERSASEVRWLRRARDVNPAMAPEVLADFPAEHAFVLRFLPGCPVWKDELIAGRVDADFAAAVGRRIAAVHSATAGNPADCEAFPDNSMFLALRVDPFILHIARKDAELAPILTALADRLLSCRAALVHGDVSPKNILVSKCDGHPVLLDAECAWYGDPAFDAAFCLNHLLLKSIHLPALRGNLLDQANAFATTWLGHFPAELRPGIEARVAALLPCLMLARVDGKSPVEYLSETNRQVVRDRAIPFIRNPPSGVVHLLDSLHSSSLQDH